MSPQTIHHLEIEIQTAVREMALQSLSEDARGEKEHYVAELIRKYEEQTGQSYNPIREVHLT